MVWGNIGNDGYVSLEVIDVVKLEAAQLQHVDVMLFGSYLIGVALSDVPSEPYVQTGLLQKVEYQ